MAAEGGRISFISNSLNSHKIYQTIKLGHWVISLVTLVKSASRLNIYHSPLIDKHSLFSLHGSLSLWVISHAVSTLLLRSQGLEQTSPILRQLTSLATDNPTNSHHRPLSSQLRDPWVWKLIALKGSYHLSSWAWCSRRAWPASSALPEEWKNVWQQYHGQVLF